MPFFLKPCLKLRRKKNKKKQKSGEVITRVSDVTAPVSTEETWQDYGISATASNASGNADLSIQGRERGKAIEQHSSSESGELSLNECITNENDEMNSRRALVAISRENISSKNGEKPGIFSINANKKESNTGGFMKEYVEISPTLSDTQVDITERNDDKIPKHAIENPAVLCSQDIFNQSNDGNFYNNFNDINVNTNVFRKIEELKKIQSSLNHGNQTLAEQVGQNNDNEGTGIHNREDGYLKKQQITNEAIGGDEINKPQSNGDLLKTPDIDKKLNTSEKNIENICQSESNIDEKDKQTQIEHQNYDFAITANCSVTKDATDVSAISLKQRKNNLSDKISFAESSSFKLTNNLTDSKDGEVEASENDTVDFYDECLNVKENSEVDFSPRGGSDGSDLSSYKIDLGKCTKSSSKFKNENVYSMEEVHDYFREMESTGKSILPGIYGLNENGSTECNEIVKPGPTPTHSSPEKLLTHETDIVAKRSEPRKSSSSTFKLNVDSNNDCNEDGTEIKIPLGETHKHDLIGGHTDESITRQKDLDLNYEEVKLANYHETCNPKNIIENSKTPWMNNGEKTSLNANKKTTLEFQDEKHGKSLQTNGHKYPSKLKKVNAVDNNGNILVEKKDHFSLEDVRDFKILHKRTLTVKCKQTDKISHLKKDFGGQNSVKRSITSSQSDVWNNEEPSSFSNMDQSSLKNTSKKPEILEKNNVHYDNEFHHSLSDTSHNEEYPPNKGTHEISEHSPTGGTNLLTKNVENYTSVVEDKAAKDKKISEYNVSLKYPSPMEHTCRRLYSDTACADKIYTSSLSDITNSKKSSHEGCSTSPYEHSDFIYFNDNCQVRYSASKISTKDSYHHYDNNCRTWENADRTGDFAIEEFNDSESPTDPLSSQTLKDNEGDDDTDKERLIEEYCDNNTDAAYERYFASENMQSPKRLNRFSNISSASESSRSSRFSENGGCKEIAVKKRESRRFSFSACGDIGNDDRVDEANDTLKTLQNSRDEIGREETRLQVEMNGNHDKKPEHKITISFTKKQNRDALRNIKNITNTKHSEALSSNFKSLDSNEIVRRQENIEIFNKKKMQALSDMKPNIRVVPVQKAETTNISSHSIENALALHRKRSPILKLSLNSHVSEVERNLEELMPESLLDVNKNNETSHALLHNNSVGRSLSRENTYSVPYSESDSESSQNSEQMTPVRKLLLDASREIRSPKLPFRTQQRLSRINARYLKRPVIIRSPKLNLVAYLTKDEKNIYQIKKGYRMYNHESRNYKILSPEKIEYRQSNFRRHQPENVVNNRATSPEYLKVKFDDIFKRYARKGRSNGELISYKRSTEWLRDAGIIGKALTAEEATNAFKCTAGVKVALNKGDYRHYLKKLARIKRLNYNEIYKRLCSPTNSYHPVQDGFNFAPGKQRCAYDD